MYFQQSRLFLYAECHVCFSIQLSSQCPNILQEGYRFSVYSLFYLCNPLLEISLNKEYSVSSWALPLIICDFTIWDFSSHIFSSPNLANMDFFSSPYAPYYMLKNHYMAMSSLFIRENQQDSYSLLVYSIMLRQFNF